MVIPPLPLLDVVPLDVVVAPAPVVTTAAEDMPRVPLLMELVPLVEPALEAAPPAAAPVDTFPVPAPPPAPELVESAGSVPHAPSTSPARQLTQRARNVNIDEEA